MTRRMTELKRLVRLERHLVNVILFGTELILIWNAVGMDRGA